MVCLRPASGPPLLVASFAYFFRREVETNEELAHGLLFDSLRQLSSSHAKGLAELRKSLDLLGENFDRLFDQLGRIESDLSETKSAALATHEAVLDLETELKRQGARAEGLAGLIAEVLKKVSSLALQKGEVKPHHSLSIRSDSERLAVKQLLERFRKLPAEVQNDLPALQNGLGKLLFGAGDFAGAREAFETASQKANDPSAQAETHFNAYRAALEERNWQQALHAILQAASLDPQRFSPFPLHRYQPRQILGAGGFGTAFLCSDTYLGTEVVVKTLHEDSVERGISDVFREAILLRGLHHPCIIGMQHCEFADPTAKARPFLVMDYFEGVNLEAFVLEHGCLTADQLKDIASQIAEAMRAAHARNILHRDLKPANVLLRKGDQGFQVKIIDFGLAVRKETFETSIASRSEAKTILAESVAGTLRYAPPEQMGELKGVRPGPYSDVYAFGKLCFFALFKTTEPKRRQLASIPENLAILLESCTETELERRTPNFDAVLRCLANPTKSSAAVASTGVLEGSQESIPEAIPVEDDPPAVIQPEYPMAEYVPQTSHESELSKLVMEVLEDSQGHIGDEAKETIDRFCGAYRIASRRGAEIVTAARDVWARTQESVSASGDEAVAAMWHYHKNGSQHGPVSESTIRQLLNRGELNASDYVWKTGMEAWMTIENAFSTGTHALAKQTAKLTIDVIGANQVAQTAEKAFRGFLSIARDGLAGLKPFTSDVIRFYLDGSYVGEGPTAGDFSVSIETVVGDRLIEVARYVDDAEQDRTQFRVPVPQGGNYSFRLDLGRRILGGMASSRLELVEG
ncbi:MAG: protein kinase [Gemmataceae bacterium]|nr:protein kinase [Gemmataceae bacterium]